MSWISGTIIWASGIFEELLEPYLGFQKPYEGLTVPHEGFLVTYVGLVLRCKGF